MVKKEVEKVWTERNMLKVNEKSPKLERKIEKED
jgi:hypothetical protein